MSANETPLQALRRGASAREAIGLRHLPPPDDPDSQRMRLFLESEADRHFTREQRGEKEERFWMGVLDQVSKGNYVMANMAIELKRGNFKLWGPIMEGLFDPDAKNLKGKISGAKRRGSFVQLFEEFGFQQNPGQVDPADVFGTMADIVVDPINLIGGAGLTKLGKLSKIAGQQSRAARRVGKIFTVGDAQGPIGQEMRDILRTRKSQKLIKSGQNPLELGQGFAEQARRGQRSLLQLERPSFARPGVRELIERPVSGAVGGAGISAGVQLASEGQIDPEEVLRGAAVGAAAGGLTVPLKLNTFRARGIPIASLPEVKTIGQIPLPDPVEGAVFGGLSRIGKLIREDIPGVATIAQAGGKLVNQWFRPKGIDPQVWDEFTEESKLFQSSLQSEKEDVLDRVQQLGLQENSSFFSRLIGSDAISASDKRLVLNAIESPQRLQSVRGKPNVAEEITLRILKTIDPEEIVAKAASGGEDVNAIRAFYDQRIQAHEDAIQSRRAAGFSETDEEVLAIQHDLQRTQQARALLDEGGGGGAPPPDVPPEAPPSPPEGGPGGGSPAPTALGPTVEGPIPPSVQQAVELIRLNQDQAAFDVLQQEDAVRFFQEQGIEGDPVDYLRRVGVAESPIIRPIGEIEVGPNAPPELVAELTSIEEARVQLQGLIPEVTNAADAVTLQRQVTDLSRRQRIAETQLRAVDQQVQFREGFAADQQAALKTADETRRTKLSELTAREASQRPAFESVDDVGREIEELAAKRESAFEAGNAVEVQRLDAEIQVRKSETVADRAQRVGGETGAVDVLEKDLTEIARRDLVIEKASRAAEERTARLSSRIPGEFESGDEVVRGLLGEGAGREVTESVMEMTSPQFVDVMKGQFPGKSTDELLEVYANTRGAMGLNPRGDMDTALASIGLDEESVLSNTATAIREHRDNLVGLDNSLEYTPEDLDIVGGWARGENTGPIDIAYKYDGELDPSEVSLLLDYEQMPSFGHPIDDLGQVKVRLIPYRATDDLAQLKRTKPRAQRIEMPETAVDIRAKMDEIEELQKAVGLGFTPTGAVIDADQALIRIDELGTEVEVALGRVRLEHGDAAADEIRQMTESPMFKMGQDHPIPSSPVINDDPASLASSFDDHVTAYLEDLRDAKFQSKSGFKGRSDSILEQRRKTLRDQMIAIDSELPSGIDRQNYEKTLQRLMDEDANNFGTWKADQPDIAARVTEVQPKKKTPKTRRIKGTTKAGEPLIDKSQYTGPGKVIAAMTRESLETLTDDLVDLVSDVQLYDVAGRPTPNTVSTKELFDAIRRDSEAVSDVKFNPETSTMDILTADGDAIVIEFDLPVEGSFPPGRSVGTFDGEETWDLALNKWIETHKSDPMMRAALEERVGVDELRNWLKDQPGIERTFKGRLATMRVKPDDIINRPVNVTYDPVDFERIGQSIVEPVAYPKGAAVIGPDGKLGLVRSTAGDTRTVEFPDGTKADILVEDLDIAELRRVANEGESIVDWVRAKFQEPRGFIRIGKANTFLDRVFGRDPELRRAFATEVVDDIIRLKPELNHLRQQAIQWLDAMSLDEEARGITHGFIQFYFPHVRINKSLWKWFMGRGQLKKTKSFFEHSRNLEGTIDEINDRAVAAGLDKIFNEDLLVGLAVRGTQSRQAVKTYDFINRIGNRFGVQVDQMKANQIGNLTQMMRHVYNSPDNVVNRVKELDGEMKRLVRALSNDVDLDDLDALDLVVDNDALNTKEFLDAGKKILSEGREDLTERLIGIQKELKELVPDVGVYLPRGAFRMVPMDTIPSELVERGIIDQGNMTNVLAALTGAKLVEGEQMVAVPLKKIRQMQLLTKIGVEAYLMPKEIADGLNKGIGNYTQFGPELQPFFDRYDALQNWWKKWTLAIFPEYHTRNVVGNIWNMGLGGFDDPGLFGDAARIQSHKFSGEYEGFVDGFGKTHTWEQLEKDMREFGVINRGWYAADIPKSVESQIEKRGIASRFLASKDKGAIKRTLAGLRDAADFLPLVGGDRNHMLRLGLRTGQMFENNARIAMYLDGLKKGYSPGASALRTKKYLFDYNDLTVIERNIFKRLFPFYAWTRFNIPLQLRSLITRPAKFIAVGKAARGAEQSLFGDQPPDPSLVPEWMKDMAPVPVRRNEDGTVSYFLLGSWLPAADVVRMFDVPAMLGGMLTPIIKAPREAILNYSPFFQDKIERTPRETGLFFNIRMRRRDITFLRNFRLLNKADKLLFNKKMPERQRIMNVIAGRLYPVDFDEQIQWEKWRLEREIRVQDKVIKKSLKNIREDRKEDRFGGNLSGPIQIGERATLNAAREEKRRLQNKLRTLKAPKRVRRVNRDDGSESQQNILDQILAPTGSN